MISKEYHFPGPGGDGRPARNLTDRDRTKFSSGSKTNTGLSGRRDADLLEEGSATWNVLNGWGISTPKWSMERTHEVKGRERLAEQKKSSLTR
jgi:hypothetical protein